VPIAGGEMLSDTLLGLETLARSIALRNLMPWINAGIDCGLRNNQSIEESIQLAGLGNIVTPRSCRLRPAGLCRLTRLNNRTWLPSSS
jgi:hypothetical protein